MDSNGRLYSNERSMYTSKTEGMIPSKVADHHVKVCNKVLELALEKSNLTIQDIDLISYSRGPGLGHALRVGNFFAKLLSLKYNKPLIGINHSIAHLSIGRIEGATDPVLLYASGANTQIIAYSGGRYRIFGESLDIGIGNLLDVFARHAKLEFPGGPKIMELAKKSNNYIEIPYNVKGMDLNFGGILTNLKQKLDKGFNLNDLSYSLQETVFSMLLEVSERAMAHCNKTELLLGGGVACNNRLQEMSKEMCNERDAKFFIPENQFLVDNGAMIAWEGILESKNKKDNPHTVKIKPYWRVDEVDVNWLD